MRLVKAPVGSAQTGDSANAGAEVTTARKPTLPSRHLSAGAAWGSGHDPHIAPGAEVTTARKRKQ